MSGADNIIPTLNRLVRTSRHLLKELGRAPSAEELARRPALPVERVRKPMPIARLPVSLAAPAAAAGRVLKKSLFAETRRSKRCRGMAGSSPAMT